MKVSYCANNYVLWVAGLMKLRTLLSQWPACARPRQSMTPIPLPRWTSKCRKWTVQCSGARSRRILVANQAHLLKGSAGNVGALELQQLGLEIEIAGKDKNHDQIGSLVSSLDAAFDHLKFVINRDPIPS